MIGVMVQQKVRIECDHCGKPAGYEGLYFDTIVQARKFAEAMQYHLTFYTIGPNKVDREIHLCPECYKKGKAITLAPEQPS